MPSATLFTSRPVRTVGHMVTPDMVDLWRTGSSPGSTQRPVVGILQGRFTVSDLVGVLSTAKLNGERLTFDVKVLEGDLGKSDGPLRVHRYDIGSVWAPMA